MSLLRTLFGILLFGLGAFHAATAAGPAETPKPMVQGSLCDPCLPPALQGQPAAPETRGAALQAQVERKLRESFDAADVGKRGVLTRDQARAAGLGVIVNHFDRIDSTGRGAVSFEDVQRYLRARGSRF